MSKGEIDTGAEFITGLLQKAKDIGLDYVLTKLFMGNNITLLKAFIDVIKDAKAKMVKAALNNIRMEHKDNCIGFLGQKVMAGSFSEDYIMKILSITGGCIWIAAGVISKEESLAKCVWFHPSQDFEPKRAESRVWRSAPPMCTMDHPLGQKNKNIPQLRSAK